VKRGKEVVDVRRDGCPSRLEEERAKPIGARTSVDMHVSIGLPDLSMVKGGSQVIKDKRPFRVEILNRKPPVGGTRTL
jgi:hypothetical protein